MKYRDIKGSFGCTCLDCLNKQFRTRLKEYDCDYDVYPHVCSKCGKVKMIVNDIRFRKRMLLIFK